MLKMFHYMKERWHYIVMIILLLFVQAFCDLSLPDYTSKIVNVGIQQKGIEDGVPETLRKESMEQVCLFMDEKDAKKVKDFYKEDGDVYRLKDVTEEEREDLNQILGIPEMVVSGLWDDSSAEVTKIKEQLQVPKETNLLELFSQMPKEQLQAMTKGMTEKFEDMPESIITQSSVLFVQSEYEAQGKDLDAMQTQYILGSGLKMLGLALLAMAAAVTVTFLSSQAAATLGKNLRNQVYRKVISFSGGELNHFSTASLITRSTNDVQQYCTVCSHSGTRRCV